jgi:hypothetical protein
VRVVGGGSALGAVTPPAPTPEEMARAYARTIRWRLRIPGEHYSGLSNEALLAVRAREGRDFAVETPLLRANASRALYAEARAWARWSEVRADNVWSDAVFDQILARLENGGGEGFAVRPLTPRYAAWKAKHGGAGKPIGVLTGRWRRALTRGRVEVL